MKTRVIVLVFVVQVLFPGLGNAQGYMRFGNTPVTQQPQQQPAIAEPVVSDNSIWTLPPLPKLIDAALEKSPMVELANTNIQMGQYEFKDVCWEWIKRINIALDARYGSMFLIMPGSATGPSTNSEMWNYGAGMNAYIPISDIFDRKRPKQKARLKIEQANIQRAEIINEVTQMVINAYYDVLSAQKSLSLRNEMSLSASMLHDQSKLDFNANRISLADYTKASETYLTAQHELEMQKFNVMKAIRILEVIVGIDLVN